ncbi:DNA polymerase III subunit gamma/tau [Candidatus Woesebacteria bacterium]|nr:DNA polymerase III subunit gamma/tau [Candidatus Woesebacteria bacterium]QQG47385.1 MAG: DNA polymerase III subunit gamma/tau [Candidatus Woesebacteria bacterium]
MTLYLKYRPQTIEELDLESVRESLKSLISTGDIPHAFLFSGLKGTGKTSAARILAKIVNCESTSQKLRGPGLIEPCNKCESCISITNGASLDVIEMDAASHRGIDDIRSLNESIMLSPVNLRKKVYIIDEAHMLTVEAANAFLKTLEEPPAHAIFILATTNPEKLPSTIISRTFNLVFEKAKKEEVERQLVRVMKGEKIKVEEGVVDLIYKLSDGSFRDAVKILEQVSFNKKKISLKDAEKVTAHISSGKVLNFLEILSQKENREAVLFIEDFVNSGGNIKSFIDEVLGQLHKGFLSKSGVLKEEELKSFQIDEIANLTNLLIKAKLKIGQSYISQVPLEMAVFEWCGTKTEEKKTQKTEKSEKIQIKSIDTDLWNQILMEIRSKNVSIEALLRTSQPLSFDGVILKIGVPFRFHKEKLETISSKKILEDAVSSLTGDLIQVFYELIERKPVIAEKPKETLTTTHEADIIEAAKEIFNNV